MPQVKDYGVALGGMYRCCMHALLEAGDEECEIEDKRVCPHCYQYIVLDPGDKGMAPKWRWEGNPKS